MNGKARTLLLERSRVQVGEEPGESTLRQACSVIEYLPDAQVVAEGRLVEGLVLSLSKGRDGQLPLPKLSCGSEYV